MPDFDPKKFDLEHWWKMLAAAGGAMTVASIAVKFPPTIFAGLGILSIGVGEWINHPYREVVNFPHKWFGHPRLPSIGGLTLDGLGAILFVVGLTKLFFA